MADLKLDLKERLILRNQYRILELVDPDEAASHRRAITILEQGFELEYPSLASTIDPDALSPDRCREVHDILDMHRRLADSYEQLDDKEGIDAKSLRFRGFDGNNEPAYLLYGEFLNSQGKWEESKVINSHMPTLGMYRRMLKAYAPFKDKRPLSKQDIQTVLAAQLHPSMRQA